MKNILRHASSFIAPLVMGFLLPYIIVRSEQRGQSGSWLSPSPALWILGLLIFVVGFALLISAIRLFILIGRGTIMPWDPTRRLIITGLYQHVRNPMILSVLIIQVGQALLFASRGIALLAAFFFIINTLYFIASEEPGLEKRFGEEYREYKRNVPRWIPRRSPWRPG